MNGKHHDRQDERRGEDADAVGRAAEKIPQVGHASERIDDPGLDMLLEPGREDEKTPDAVDDAGNAGEQLDGDADGTAQRPRTNLGQEDRDADADWNGDEHRQNRGDECAVDRGQRAELLGDRIPGFRVEEGPTEMFDRRKRADDQREHHAGKNGQHEQRRAQCEKTETGVAGAALAHSGGSFGDAAHLLCKGDVGHGSLRAPVLDEIVGQPKSRPKAVTETHPTGVARKDHHSFAKLL